LARIAVPLEQHMEPRAVRVNEWLEARPAAPEHAEALADLVQRNTDHLRKHLPAVVEINTTEKAQAHIAGAAGRAERDEVLEWYLFADGVMCGAVRLNKIELANRKVSIAYLLDEAHQGRGIATLALEAFLAYCFGDLGMNRVELTAATDNLRSVRLVERVGFVREGLLRQAEWLGGAFVDHYVYGMLCAEFLTRTGEYTGRRAGPHTGPA
jgi:ribosomal-protein-serine acetyltransferase